MLDRRAHKRRHPDNTRPYQLQYLSRKVLGPVVPQKIEHDGFFTRFYAKDETDVGNDTVWHSDILPEGHQRDTNITWQKEHLMMQATPDSYRLMIVRHVMILSFRPVLFSA